LVSEPQTIYPSLPSPGLWPLAARRDAERVVLQSLVAGLSDGAAAVEAEAVVLALVVVVLLSCAAFLLGSMTALMTGGGHSEVSVNIIIIMWGWGKIHVTIVLFPSFS